ncbi:MAG: KR domain-containing protein [Holosporaceae bacterium]|jgi:polyketide synthase PksJ|nr:KR domain-containing protein [Holosporaceae bacterium]
MSNENKIAVIGFSGQFPNANDVSELWKNVFNSVDCTKKFSRDEVDAYHNDLGYVDSKNYKFVGGYPEGFSSFDAAFFGISPKEALFMDPQQRKFLEHAYLALEHAGYNPLEAKGCVGVFASEGVNSYLLNNIIDSGNWSEDDKEMSIYGCGYDYLATRISYLLNLKGPSLTVQSGCSGSLVSVHMAVQSLMSYESDMALTGGVSILTPVQAGYMFQQNGILSESGVCRPFDKDADGTVFTNGYGVVVLKRLEDAIADGDTVFATIIASAINNDGSEKISYSAPSVSGQKNVISTALSMAEIDQRDVGYIECHGTGTKLGDPIEFQSLIQAFSETSKNNSCVIGSVKSYLGHMNSAAGIVGLLTALGCILHKKLPGVLHYNQSNPEIDVENSPFKILKETVEWKSNEKRIAGVSSFGVGGTNVHVILEEYKDSISKTNENREVLFMLSAKSKTSLEKQILKWQKFLEENTEINLNDCFFTLAVRRPVFEYKTAFLISSEKDLLEKLKKAEIVYSKMSGKNVNAIGSDLQKLKKAFLSGDNIIWSDYFTDCKRIPLPAYSFDEDKYWIDIGYRKEGSGSINRKNPNIDEWFYTPMYVEDDFCDKQSDLTKKWLIIEPENNLVSNAIQKIYPDLPVTTIHLNDVKSREEYFEIFEKLKRTSCLPDVIVHGYSLNNFEDDRQILENGLFSLLYTVQALSSANRNSQCTIAIVTNKITSIVDEDFSPLKSTIFGISKTINKEYPYSCKVLDIGQDITKQIISEIENSNHEFAIYRNNRKFIEKYRKIDIKESKIKLQNGTYIITGGLGYFGLDIASLISRKTKNSKIVLIGRSKFPWKSEWEKTIENNGPEHGLSKKIIRLQQIENNGATVYIEQADTKNFSDIENIFAKYGASEGIAGVIHAAGVVESSILDRKTIESFDTLFDAKVWGSINVVKAGEKYNPNFIVLCSSMNSMIGGLGQADNTASTSFVDYFARYCRSKNKSNVFAINWGAVNQSRKRDFESLLEFRDLSEEHFKNRMTEEERSIVFERLLKNGPRWHRVIISTIELNSVLERWNEVSTVTSLVKDRKTTRKKRSEIGNLKSAKIIWPKNKYEEGLSDYFSDILGIDVISADDNFFELGGHSLSAIRLNEKIKSNFGLSLHAMSIYEYPVLSDLASFIKDQIESKLHC